MVAGLCARGHLAGTRPHLDQDRVEYVGGRVARMFKSYVRTRRVPPLEDSCEVVLLPGWALTEPHFPDGFRYYGHRGTEAARGLKGGAGARMSWMIGRTTTASSTPQGPTKIGRTGPWSDP